MKVTKTRSIKTSSTSTTRKPFAEQYLQERGIEVEFAVEQNHVKPTKAGIVFTKVHPLTRVEMPGSRTRLAVPVIGRDGKKQKFTQEPGTGNFPYFAPCMNWKKIFNDPTAPLILSEGETRSLAGAKHGYAVVGNGGVDGLFEAGSHRQRLNSIYEKVDWKNRDTILWFDADLRTNNNVRDALTAAANLLADKGADVRIAETPAIGESAGLDDVLAKPYGPQLVNDILEAAPRWAEMQEPEPWEQPVPLPDETPAVEPFDPAMLPIALRRRVMDVADRMQCAPDIPAATSIFALGIATGRRVMIQPKANDTGFRVVPNLWGAVVAAPGEKKTPAMQAILKPLDEIERGWASDFARESDAFRATSENHKTAVQKWKDDCKTANDSSKPAPMPPQSITEPRRKRLYTSDGTTEAIQQMCADNPAGIGVLVDEIPSFLAGLERQGREQSKGMFLAGWSGDQNYTIDTIGRGTITADPLCVAVFGGIQPLKLNEYLGITKNGITIDGLLQRFQLLVSPDRPTEWQYVDREPDQAAEQHFAALCKTLAKFPVESPLVLKFEPKAQALYIEWLGALVKKVRGFDASPVMQQHLTKFQKLLPALALLFALADGRTDVVPLSSLQLAIRWTQYLESHALRVYAAQLASSLTTAQLLGKKLLDGWRRSEGTFSVRDVYRPKWSGLTEPVAVRTACTFLVDLGWIRRQPAAKIGRPSEAFDINPAIYQMSENEPNTSGSFGSLSVGRSKKIGEKYKKEKTRLISTRQISVCLPTDKLPKLPILPARKFELQPTRGTRKGGK